jgi:hypothetical protein
MVIIIREVPTALFIGNLPIKNKIGIIMKPPPAPTNPVIKPVIIPAKRKINRLLASSHFSFRSTK